MKHLILLLTTICMLSCAKKPAPKKPFTIIDKDFCHCGSETATYRYIDSKGEEYSFEEGKDKYTVGQVIN